MVTTEKIASRPLPLVPEMVRKTLLGIKRRSRRPLKPQPARVDRELRFKWATFFDSGHVHTWGRDGAGGQNWEASGYPAEDKFTAALRRTPYTNPCPHGRPGDRLWVRETARLIETSDGMSYAGNVTDDPENHRSVRLKYEADGAESDWLPYPARLEYLEVGQAVANGCYREAARIHLEITDIRVEQVQSITEAEAELEGAPRAIGQKIHGWTPRVLGFSELWDSLYLGELSWRANPWVWAISFERVMLDQPEHPTFTKREQQRINRANAELEPRIDWR